jgi:hypothetical protein
MISTILLACNNSNGVSPTPGTGIPELKRYSNQVVLDWNQMAFKAMAAPPTSTFCSRHVSTRWYTWPCTNALNGVVTGYKTYSSPLRGSKANSIAATAAHGVLLASFPDKKLEFQCELF